MVLPATLQHLERSLGGNGALPHGGGAASTGKVALTCRFACDTLRAELYDWDEAERG